MKHTNQCTRKDNQPSFFSKLAFPHVYLILGGFIIISAIMTYFVAAGQYERVLLPNGRFTVVDGSYQTMTQTPVGFEDLITAIPIGLEEAASVVFLTLLVGGSVGVIRRTGVLDFGLQVLLKRTKCRPYLVILMLMTMLSLISGCIGVPELGIAYLPIIMPLIMTLGYDTITATAIALLAPTLGFAMGITVPATVGIAHILSDLPMYSGALYRFIWFTIIIFVSTVYLLRYATKVKNNPQASYNYNEDQKLRIELSKVATIEDRNFTGRQKVGALVAATLFVATVASILIFRLGFTQLSGVFVLLAIVVSVIVGHSPNKICDNFNQGFSEMLFGAMIVGVARGISVIMDAGNITDTLVYNIASLINELPASLSAVGILFYQAIFNFFVPSGSGKMLVTLPILIPLGDLLEINRQIVVLASQWGDGISNIFFPTSGYFMAILALGRVNYFMWVKFFTPLLAIIGLLTTVGIIVAQYIELGPF